MKLYLLFLSVSLLFIFSCRNTNNKITLDEETYSYYLQNGNTISAKAQSALLSNVASAMKKGGSLYAVEFCSLRASGITDSIKMDCNCNISRISGKNRNPDNGLNSKSEQQLWEYYLSVNNAAMWHDTILVEGQNAVYYKPIITGMPACLNCHGPEDEIDPSTYRKIAEIYPDDKATGYTLNEFRGLWKIEFELDNIN